eukprot:scaffold31641_cov48-Phaeocystis_antarctica.AAC.3
MDGWADTYLRPRSARCWSTSRAGSCSGDLGRGARVHVKGRVKAAERAALCRHSADTLQAAGALDWLRRELWEVWEVWEVWEACLPWRSADAAASTQPARNAAQAGAPPSTTSAASTSMPRRCTSALAGCSCSDARVASAAPASVAALASEPASELPPRSMAPRAESAHTCVDASAATISTIAMSGTTPPSTAAARRPL